MLAPVALFVYRRLEHTVATVEALLRNPEAADTDLIVFSDAARDRTSEGHVARVRSYVRGISGFRSTTIVERSANLGLANSVVDGVTRLCAERTKVVVVEDDLVVSPRFLDYMNRALELYRDADRVMQVSGYMFPVAMSADQDAFFLPLTTSWGWATWERSWRLFDPAAGGRVQLANDPSLQFRFNLRGAYDYAGMLHAQLAGRIDSWAIRWYLSVFLHDGLVLYPAKTLVHNRGFGVGATHGAAPAEWGQVGDWTGFRVERFPAQVAPDPAFDDVVEYIRGSVSRRPKGMKAKLNELVAKIKGKG